MKAINKSIPAILLATAWGLMSSEAAIVVNSLLDPATPAPGETTLRSALAAAASGEPILFDPALDGGTVELSGVGEEHTVLVGEVMGFDVENNISYLVGYHERDYGRSALYTTNDVVIDASALTNGITIKWMGGDADPARVLAVYGDLTLKNASITGGRCVSTTNVVSVGGYDQASTRARGGGLAVWGVAHLENCRIYDNACGAAVMDPGRDAGIFGGGIYADIVDISDSTISGNRLAATGVSGGGVFSVGGAEASGSVSTIKRCSITGNRIAGIFAYGGGVYSDGGGIGNLKTLELQNCTIADNLVGIDGPGFLYGSGYWRGSAVYMSNGHMKLHGCTVVNNQTHGVARTNELEKPNMAGAVACTIGNAHAVEYMFVGHSILTGNTVHELGGSTYPEDIFTGSLLLFYSEGYNRIGTINFSQILVPVGERQWYSLCRKHYPKAGDQDGVELADVLDLSYGTAYSPDILSAGVAVSNPAVLYYVPNTDAIDQVPADPYELQETRAEYELADGGTNNFLEIMLGRLETHYGLTGFATNFTAGFETFLAGVDTDPDTEGNQPYTTPGGSPILTLADTQFFGPAKTWPAQEENYPYIEFWHRLDTALLAENIPGMGQQILGDAEWNLLFDDGPLTENTNLYLYIWDTPYNADPLDLDQNGTSRPANGLGDIGAIEYKPPETLLVNLDVSNATNNQLQVYWNGTPNRTYDLWGASNLLSNDWSLIDGNITSTLPVNVHSVETTPDKQFFKVDMH